MNKITKALCALAISFLTLNIFCLFYYNTPVHYDNKDGSTDYYWDKNYYYARMSEGFGYGKTNNEGMMNEFDYENSTNINVLIMGSSHIENQYIPMQDNVVSLLNDSDPDRIYYNLGISGHNFKVCITNLEKALEKYNPEYVIIETDTVLYDSETIEQIISLAIPDIPSTRNPLSILLQHIPFVRLAVSQADSFIENNQKETTDINYLEQDFDSDNTTKLLNYIKNTAKKYNAEVVILYHPTIITYDKDGFTYQIPEKTVSQFKELCEEYDIAFLDMSERFQTEYQNNYTIPYGFANSKVAFGHLNIEGHKMMAEEILKLIKR